MGLSQNKTLNDWLARNSKSLVRIIGESWKTKFGFVVFVITGFFALAANLVSPFNPNIQNLTQNFLPPFWAPGGTIVHILGTDELGRDMLSRLIFGSREAMAVGFAAAGVSTLVGTTLGLWGGYYKGIQDHIVTRLIDIWMSLPPVLLIIVLIGVEGISFVNLVLAIAAVEWTRFARVIRSETLDLREQDYVIAAKTSGSTNFQILKDEIFPNIVPTLVVLFTLDVGIAVAAEIVLSFAGLGVASSSSWGLMIYSGLSYVQFDPWMITFPVIVVIVVILGINLLGDGLRQTLDPRVQHLIQPRLKGPVAQE